VDQASDWNSPSRPKLWLYNLHYFNDLSATASAGRAVWQRDLILRWLDENPPGQGNGWEAYPTSLRVVNWIKWLLDGNRGAEQVVQSLAVQTRWLSSHIERHLLGNHLLANAKALAFAGLFFEGREADGFYARGMSLFEEQLNEQILTDGGHYELSPMYHLLVLEDLLDLVNVHLSFGRPVPAICLANIEKMFAWAMIMCHPDGEIPFFNDASLGVAPAVGKLKEYAERLGVNVSTIDKRSGVYSLPTSGYVCLTTSHVTVFLDAAPLGPDYLPAHGHADTLSIELSIDGVRCFVNGGTSQYDVGAVRQRERGTAAHTTVIVDGQDSSEVWSAFRVGKRAKPSAITVHDEAEPFSVSASHDGYGRRFHGPQHRRHIELGSDGMVVIDDLIGGRFRKAVANFHLAPGWSVSVDDSSSGAFELNGEKRIAWRVDGADPKATTSTYSREFNLYESIDCLSLEFSGRSSRLALRWLPT
jgi:uncharacterized heparinase superfamily protein